MNAHTDAVPAPRRGRATRPSGRARRARGLYALGPAQLDLLRRSRVPTDTTSASRGRRGDGAGALDLELVAHIVRRAGLECRTDRTSPFLLHARQAGDKAPWTVVAGTCHDHPVPRAFVGPAGATRTRVLREPDERRLAALVVLQALRRDPHELLTHDEASASGLADTLIWT